MGVLHPNKVGDIFTTQPNENNIHIIVELPTSPSGTFENYKRRIKRSIDTFTDNSMNQTHLDELLNHLNFCRAISVITVDSTDKVFDEQFFWNSGWIRTEEKGPRYSCLSSHYRAYRDKYSFKFCRFLVLTDLNDCWIFYWLSNDRTVMMFRAIDSSNALDIIGRTLDEDSISTATTTIDPNFPIGSRINFCHLGNLQGEASENVDLFFNRPKVQFEFEDDVANMKDMFDEMTEEEIKGWKVRRVIKLFG
ncbi:21254_t:CDS:2 [Rhizophagus irregularis]|nr:21254_t:CDS:2 [Rhizophagus irregularis]